jgi:hypothetical protein
MKKIPFKCDCDDSSYTQGHAVNNLESCCALLIKIYFKILQTKISAMNVDRFTIIKNTTRDMRIVLQFVAYAIVIIDL